MLLMNSPIEPTSTDSQRPDRAVYERFISELESKLGNSIDIYERRLTAKGVLLPRLFNQIARPAEVLLCPQAGCDSCLRHQEIE